MCINTPPVCCVMHSEYAQDMKEEHSKNRQSSPSSSSLAYKFNGTLSGAPRSVHSS